MYIDMHAHYVPPKVLSVLEHDPSPYGAKLIEDAGGSQCVHFAYGLTIRPFFPELLDLEERWHEMDRQGVDRQILSVWTDLSGYGMSLEEGARWHRLLNEIICDEARQHSPRLSALASVPLQDAQRAAHELEYSVRQCGAVGGDRRQRRWQQPWGSPIRRVLAAAVDLAVPIFIHPTQPTPLLRTRNYGLNQIVQYTYDTTASVGSLIFSGVLDRFPALTLILSHGGGIFHTRRAVLTASTVISRPRLRRRNRHRPICVVSFTIQSYTILPHSAICSTWWEAIDLLLGTDYPFPMDDRTGPETAGAGWLYRRRNRPDRRRHRTTLVQALSWAMSCIQAIVELRAAPVEDMETTGTRYQWIAG